MKLIKGLRPNDSVAVYALKGGITELQSFTTDKSAAARAVLQTEPGGMTALHDGLVRTVRDIAGRAGKKAMVVFTDGEDNISMFPAEPRVLRAKTAGVPIYIIAKGTELRGDAATIGVDLPNHGRHVVRASLDFRDASAFEKVYQDVMHGYLLPSSRRGRKAMRGTPLKWC